VTEPFRFAPDLDGRRAVITGGGSGIGLGIGRWLVASGCSVTLIDQHFDRGGRALRKQGFSLLRHDLAVADPALVAEEVLVDGPVELIVNNVGVATGHRFTELDVGDFDRVMAINLRTPWFFTRRLVQELIDTDRRGAILFVSSLHDHVVRRFPHYSASKAAVAMLTRELAHELGPRGIRVNAISPGWIESRPLAAHERTEGRHLIPLGRHGEPSDLGPIAVVLLSDALSGYITGSNLPVDGGLDLHSWLDDKAL
jgi:NAD(P)-dependent dehydrogenase (short-subunit alcohol dehydrogenase family)